MKRIRVLLLSVMRIMLVERRLIKVFGSLLLTSAGLRRGILCRVGHGVVSYSFGVMGERTRLMI